MIDFERASHIIVKVGIFAPTPIDIQSVSWAAGTGLAPGATATFSFTTDPREIGPATITATGNGGGFLANLPTAPAPLPKLHLPRQVRINFLGNVQEYTMTVSITTKSGTFSSGAMTMGTQTPKDARDTLYTYLVDAGWAVERLGDNSMRILGKKLANGTIDGVRSGDLVVTGQLGASLPPNIQGDGGIPVTGN